MTDYEKFKIFFTENKVPCLYDDEGQNILFVFRGTPLSIEPDDVDNLFEFSFDPKDGHFVGVGENTRPYRVLNRLP